MAKSVSGFLPQSDTTTIITVNVLPTVTVTTKNLDDGKVVLKVNGKTVKNSEGKLYAKVVGDSTVFTYKLPATIVKGEYSIKAVYTSGSDKYEAESTLTIE